MIGLFTRIVAFILSGEMAFAYFLGHMFKKPEEPVFLPLLNGGTAAILFCFACLYLATAGGGPYSVDEMRKKYVGGKRSSRRHSGIVEGRTLRFAHPTNCQISSWESRSGVSMCPPDLVVRTALRARTGK